jgi:hypothetical protein
LAEWAALWGHALDGFSLDSLWLVSRGRWSPRGGGTISPLVTGEDTNSGADLATTLLSVRSHDNRYRLIVDSYQAVLPDGDSLIVGGEPDSRCSLVDTRDSTELVLHFSGTGGGFHWGQWLSNDEFALGGWNEADDFGKWKQGRLWLYSMRDSIVCEYQTRIISAETYQRYEAAWHGWLLARYRAWKRARRPA